MPVPSIITPKDKYITTINKKNADGSFTSYPIGAMGENVILKEGLNLEKKFEQIIIELDKGSILIPVTVRLDDWVGDQAPYLQTVLVDGVTDRTALLVNLMDKNATVDEQKIYVKNFAILVSGYIETAEGTVTFKVYNKPTADIEVGIVIGSMPIPEDISLWGLSDDKIHVAPKDPEMVIQGGGEPKEGKDLVTVEYIKNNIFKLMEDDTLLFSFLNTAYHSSMKPDVLTLIPDLFEIDETGQKLIIKNEYKEE